MLVMGEDGKGMTENNNLSKIEKTSRNKQQRGKKEKINQ